jgi:hypothetical protein
VLAKAEARDAAAAKIRAAQAALVGAMSLNDETCAAASITRTFPEHAPAQRTPGMSPQACSRTLPKGS